MVSGTDTRRILVLGGARSGKSAFAERLATSQERSVVYVATGEAGDAEMAERIRRHRARRPASWTTIEEPRDITAALARTASRDDVWLLDSVTLLVASAMDQHSALRAQSPTEDPAEEALLRELDDLFALAGAREAHLVLVGDEAGMGVVPDHPSGRRFRDLLGAVNQHLAARCDRVYFVVAGLAIEIGSRAVSWP